MNCRFIVDVRNKLSNGVNDNTRLLETFEKIICVGMPKVLKSINGIYMTVFDKILVTKCSRNFVLLSQIIIGYITAIF